MSLIYFIFTPLLKVLIPSFIKVYLFCQLYLIAFRLRKERCIDRVFLNTDKECICFRHLINYVTSGVIYFLLFLFEFALSAKVIKEKCIKTCLV